jgi:hypothetical protein
MNNYILSWLVQDKTRVIRLLKDVRAGKYVFEQHFFDHQEYNKKRKLADSKGEKAKNNSHLSISWQQTSSDSNIEIDTKNELEQLLKFLTLETNYIFTRESLSYRKLRQDGSASPATVCAESIIQRNPKIDIIYDNDIKKAVALKEKFDRLHNPEKEYVMRALVWYERGTKESDVINSYANYWIGFESLTSIFGKGPPFNCPKWGTRVQSESISKRMQEFLKRLGMTNRWQKEVKEMYCIRNKLFHQSKGGFNRTVLTNLKHLLKDCIETYLLNSPSSGSTKLLGKS